MNFKLLLSILTLSLFGINSKCQDKGNYIWNLGYALPLPFENYPDSIRMRYGGTDIDFNTSPPTFRRIEREISFNTHSTSISDINGNLLFYTNGCYVFNGQHILMENGQDINAGKFHDDYCERDYGYISGQQSLIILPDNYHEGMYYLLHEKVEQGWPDEYSSLQYSIIDMNENNGLGRVVSKNNKIMDDSIYIVDMSAVKHANGRDWWIVVPEDSNNVYNVLLLDSMGVRKEREFIMGPKVGYYGGLSGQAKISPDGKKYARYTQTEQVFLMDFDRQTGVLSNFQQIMLRDTVFSGGLEFSPNSRFLYVAVGFFVYQLDLWANDIEGSKEIVAVFDGFVDFLRTTFSYMQLTPDCRIFINTPSSSRYWHVIENPDEKGLACNLTQHSLRLPTWNFNTMPYFPNYRLGPPGNEGLPCERVSSTAPFIPEQEAKILVFPNPAKDELTIRVNPEKGALKAARVFDLLGRQVQYVDFKGDAFSEIIDLKDLKEGIYLLQALVNDHWLEVNKISIIR